MLSIAVGINVILSVPWDQCQYIYIYIYIFIYIYLISKELCSEKIIMVSQATLSFVFI